jgi:response regulator of citrate/malate metabolism
MQLLESERPDIIFLDNNLPDGLGWDMVPYIFSTHPRIKLNLISAYQPTSTIFESKNLKIWEKPFDFRSIEEYL